MTDPEFRPTSADTNRLHRIRARLLDLVPLDGTMSLADDVQRLDRALADAAAREREAIRAAIEHMRDGGPNSDTEAYVYGAVLSIIDARGGK